ncbi:MAG: asparaginase [Cyclobacteriaceae bacterium]|nr:asparaginase [Cyclobacteriaceae bacterium]
MNFKTITINTAVPSPPRARVMIIYTGGTFGMVYDAQGVLLPFDFSLILEHLPTLRSLFLEITVISFEHPIDSSNVEPTHWQSIGQIILDHYQDYDGFVVLHGTDTMAYTASALSFMLQNLSKPVVFTGAQLPITEPRSDARENLITALEIASAKANGIAQVPEVSIYFDYELLRGSRAKKVESMHFDAFNSENYPPLAKAGVKIDYNAGAIRPPSSKSLRLWSTFDTRVAVLKLFPGIPEATVRSVLLNPEMKAVILETFGAGNAPTSPWFIKLLRESIAKGLLVLNVSQCPGGMVVQGKYETSRQLAEIGVISGSDMTLEAAITKLMVLMGEFGVEKTKSLINQSLAGELSE